jgi:signal-transduction protein with cAMP-binding, CBS, and nucleotidyltransferase domain
VAALFGSKFPSLAPGNTMSISFFRITPTEIQFIDNTAASGGGAQRGEFGAEFHRERAYSVFSGLPVIAPAEIISETLQILRVDAGSVVARQGGPADKFFIVFEGQVEVVREDGGAPEALTSLGPGQFFGEAAILADRPRAATIRALEPSTLVAIDRDTFRDLLAQSLGTTREFDELIRTRLRSAGSGS